MGVPPDFGGALAETGGGVQQGGGRARASSGQPPTLTLPRFGGGGHERRARFDIAELNTAVASPAPEPGEGKGGGAWGLADSTPPDNDPTPAFG